MLIFKIIKKIFGNYNDRLINKFLKTVQKINFLEKTLQNFSNEELKEKCDMLKKNIKNHSQLDNIITEMFSLVREASKRTINMRHFDVQMIGGIVLHEGKISEMQTGEGKTLVATLAACLNSIYKKGIHVVTVNEYLAKRDSIWMFPIYNLLGFNVGVLTQNMEILEKKKNYELDIIYGTNNEFAFDYLRDNMIYEIENKIQKELYFAIIDEIDSILIDEARTPLIISGVNKNNSELYIKINNIVKLLKKYEKTTNEGDYIINEKEKSISLTENGHINVENLLTKNFLLDKNSNLYDLKNIELINHINISIKSHIFYKKNIDYIIKNNKILIIDEHTGRIMEGRRWSEGLHQAIEAKEGIPIEDESQTLATITFQNYFRMYNKICGMTGTAYTEKNEFHEIYNLEVIVIPSNKKCIRIDKSDKVYLTKEEKYEKIIEDIYNNFKIQRPVLVGTISIELSEFMSQFLQKKNISHEILNAKFHEKEANIIADAGKPKAVTIATNMAGRGTDIVLGGNIVLYNNDNLLKKWKNDNKIVIDCGGLYVIGTERHEARRIDNQLRGRAGRQGDPGGSQFYLSINDNLLRLFVSQKISLLFKKIGVKKGEVITHSWVNKAIENAQKKIEQHNFDLRKNLLEYDDVINKQRKIIYQQRNEIMNHNNICSLILIIIEDVIENIIKNIFYNNKINYNNFCNIFNMEYNYILNITKETYDYYVFENSENDIFIKLIIDEIKKFYINKNNEKNSSIEKKLFIYIIDQNWKEHLYDIEQMKKYIDLIKYARENPKEEYKKEAFKMFENVIENIKKDFIKILLQKNFNLEQTEYINDNTQFIKNDSNNINNKQNKKEENKLKRNDLCFCESKKKYKHCHGKTL